LSNEILKLFKMKMLLVTLSLFAIHLLGRAAMLADLGTDPNSWWLRDADNRVRF
jgi:hypothetical protein